MRAESNKHWKTQDSGISIDEEYWKAESNMYGKLQELGRYVESNINLAPEEIVFRKSVGKQNRIHIGRSKRSGAHLETNKQRKTRESGTYLESNIESASEETGFRKSA